VDPRNGIRVWSFYYRLVIFTAMRKIPMLVVVASIVAASITGLNVAQVVYATSSTTGTCPCGSGNPHVPDPDTGVVPQGNPHDFESGLTNGNPHIKG
jgi:hypothetical protein